MKKLRKFIIHITPKPILDKIRPQYHLFLNWLGKVYYRNPSKDITVIGVTGTKGKSSVTEILRNILTEHGYKVASVSTIHFTIGEITEKNLYKMTMPGRFFLQKFIRRAVTENCSHIIIEMTSEGARLNRHRYIEMDCLIFTNLSPEHIESHGSFANYKAAKLKLAEQLSNSKKQKRTIIANSDDEHGKDFLKTPVEKKLPYSLKDLQLHMLHKDSISLTFPEITIRAPFVGIFNVYNLLASITYARSIDISWKTIESALRTHPPIKGRVEKFYSKSESTKPITVVVDYAHTTNSLEQLYKAFPDTYKICVLGNTGGGRDTWKRPEMASIAESYCDKIFLTNEDPYDEDPQSILNDMYKGIVNKKKVEMILDRKKAISKAIEIAPAHSHVIISGKGTDPFIMGPDGLKEPWSDASIVKEILENKDI